MDRSYQTANYEENPDYCYYHRPVFFPFAIILFIFVPLFFIFKPFFFFRYPWIFWAFIFFIPLWIVIASTGRERRRYRHYRRYHTQYIQPNELAVPVNTANNQQTNHIMFCSNCGSKASSNDRFCSSCGYHLE